MTDLGVGLIPPGKAKFVSKEHSASIKVFNTCLRVTDLFTGQVDLPGKVKFTSKRVYGGTQ